MFAACAICAVLHWLLRHLRFSLVSGLQYQAKETLNVCFGGSKTVVIDSCSYQGTTSIILSLALTCEAWCFARCLFVTRLEKEKDARIQSQEIKLDFKRLFH